MHTLGCLVPSALRASARGRDERWLVRVPGPTRDGRCAEACGVRGAAAGVAAAVERVTLKGEARSEKQKGA